ncbi:hypothetical protein V1291_000025 [Nitrobacteraceae bacterium AZCC 1564]
MNERTHNPWVTVPESEVLEWWNAGWHYVGPDASNSAYSVMEWRSEKPAVQPFDGRGAELRHIARAISSLEGAA